MAEAFGVVVSGIALAEVAAKVGRGCVTLHGLWKDVENVPARINYLMEQMEVMNPILEMMEQHTCSNPTFFQTQEYAISSALKYVHKAKEDIVSLVEDLSRDIASAKRRKRAFAKVKVVLAEKSLNMYELRLRDAIQRLQFAHQMYLPYVGSNHQQDTRTDCLIGS